MLVLSHTLPMLSEAINFYADWKPCYFWATPHIFLCAKLANLKPHRSCQCCLKEEVFQWFAKCSTMIKKNTSLVWRSQGARKGTWDWKLNWYPKFYNQDIQFFCSITFRISIQFWLIGSEISMSKQYFIFKFSFHVLFFI